MNRMHLPSRRPSEVVEFVHDGITFLGSVSFDRTWRPLELFLSTNKPGRGVETAARDGAVAMSLALQYGVPLEVLRRAVTRLDDGAPAGPLGRLLDLVVGDGSWPSCREPADHVDLGKVPF